MSLRHVVNVVGLLLVFIGLAMSVAAGVSALYRESEGWWILLSAGITLVSGYVAYRSTRFEGELTHREGFAIVTGAWSAVAAFGSLPFLLTGSIDGIVPAVFESMSGFTTTGATILTDIEVLPRGVLFWRSFTHWLGGMGIIVLAIAVLPYLGVGGMQLFRAEVPGPTPERLRPRITQTAKLLWYVYLGLTAIQSALYLAGGMDLFDAVTHSFATLATGGFSTRNTSIAAFDSAYIHYVTILFMYLAGVNFALHYRAAIGRPAYWRDSEWRFITLLVGGAGLALTSLNLAGGSYALDPAGLERAFRDGLFHATSIVTTTGFVTTDYEVWIPSAQTLIFLLMFTGGMAGSTGGGIKAVRVLLLFRQAVTELRKHLHPRAIILSRVGRKVVSEEVLQNVLGFVMLYLLLFVAGALALTLFGIDFVTALGASAATVGNIGPGIGDVGAVENYGWIADGPLGILIFLMLVGRLEIFTVLLLFHPDMWRDRKAMR